MTMGGKVFLIICGGMKEIRIRIKAQQALVPITAPVGIGTREGRCISALGQSLFVHLAEGIGCNSDDGEGNAC